MRSPEPIERVRAMVCEFCWANIFDTDGFEKLGRGETSKFEYHVTSQEIEAGLGSQCAWCESVYFGLEQSEPPIACACSLRANRKDVFTPSGSNLYQFYLENKTDWWPFRTIDIGFYTEDSNLAAQQVTSRKIETNLAPSNTSSQISTWLRECALHGCCPEQSDSRLPTRVIDVTKLRILHTNGALGKFTALSYCWGTGSHIQLRSHTVQSLIRHLDFSTLPRTIQDAILVTRLLSVRYLWVDALCIIQDDPEDKAREIGSMAKIYSKAHVTILASSAADANDGFLEQRSDDQGKIFELPYRIAPNQFGSVTIQPGVVMLPVSRQETPLGGRAWALQEQMMANRLLLYTKNTLEWRCAAGMMGLNQSLNVDLEEEPMPTLVSQLSRDPEEAFQEWIRIVEDYSRRAMSIQSDKLPAIAALAERFAPILGNYYAGLWQHDLIRQLEWAGYQAESIRRTKVYRAPSWSWASTDSEIQMLRARERHEACCTLISVQASPKNERVIYGEVTNGSITIRGKVLIGFNMGKQEGGGVFLHAENWEAESPLRQFYTVYYQQAVTCRESTQIVEVQMITRFDSWQYTRFSLPFLLLPLHVRNWPKHQYSEKYDKYKSRCPDIDFMPMCNGLILVPAGPGALRRIGVFDNLHRDEIEGLVDQEITIV